MSKLELINKYLKNAKINTKQLKKICYCFAHDFTASNTAKELGLSRQTINSYYKMIREFLIEEQDKIQLNDSFDKNCFSLKYINVNTQVIYYIQYNDTQYILDDKNKKLQKILNFVRSNVKDTLISHRKANTARILYHSPQDEYFVSTFLHSHNKLEEFINTRLKKFRGLNKNNNILHIKESIIRYNNNEDFLFNSLTKILIS